MSSSNERSSSTKVKYHIILSRSEKPTKKFKVKILSSLPGKSPGTSIRTIHFGSKGMSDYTKHKDIDRKKRYLARHKARENWNLSGILTPGFWSRWILWNKPSILSSKRDIRNRFNISIL